MALITAEARKELVALYIGMFKAAPGAANLSAMVAARESGKTLAQVAADLALKPEFSVVYPGFQTADEFATSLVANLLATDTPQVAKDFGKNWVIAQVTAGKTRSQVIVEALQAIAATTNTNYTSAKAQLTNKIDVASYYSITKGLSDPDLVDLQSVIATVTGDAATVTAAKTSIDTVVENQQGLLYTLTSGVDIKLGTSGADTFDGSVNANGTATLTSVDDLDGGAGKDLLIGGIGGGNVAPSLKNIEAVELIFGAAGTFDMVNTAGLKSLVLRNSSATATINNLASTTDTTFSIQDQPVDVNLNFTNTALAGASTFTMELIGAQNDLAANASANGSAVVITQQPGADISGLETLTLSSVGGNTNFLSSLAVNSGLGINSLTKLIVSGTQALTINTANALNAGVRTIDASGLTSATGLTAAFGATSAVTVTGSGGNDSLSFAANAGNSTINAGGGNDTITLAGFNNNDSVSGGDGSADRLVVSAADAEAVLLPLTNITGFEQLSLNTIGTAASSVNATRFGEITTVRLDAGTTGAYGVTAQAGTVTVTVGTTSGTIGGALTVTDTGTAIIDTLNVGNGSFAATNVFNGQNITSNGYETVNVRSGGLTTNNAQTIGVLTVNNDSLSGANTVKFSGINSTTVNRIDSNTSGLLTIDASGFGGTAALTMTLAPVFTVATGTVSIVGSVNADTLVGAAASASSIDGGAGNDTLTGGSAADSVSGGAGNDTINTGAGNDTAVGGEGDDAITVGAGDVNVDAGAGNDMVTLAGNLSALDTVNGGEGFDTLSLTAAATASSAAGVSNFEAVTLGAALGGQGMEQFTTNPTFTRINYGAFANAVTNVGTNVSSIGIANNATTISTDRLIDTGVNALAISSTEIAAGAVAVTSLTIDDEEVVTVDTGTVVANDFAFGALNAADLTTLTISGLGSFAVTGPIGGAANLSTINASGNQGTVSVDASSSTANLTATGAFSAANTITGGTGADTIVGGTAADSLTGGNGADSIDGGAGADRLLGGLGADTVLGNIGDDTITGGVGADRLDGGDGADDFVFSSVSNGTDTIVGFVAGTDDLDVVTGGVIAAIVAGETNTIPEAAQAISLFGTDNSVHILNFNGAAANLTIGGTATLSGADMTANTLTNLAAYLNEAFTANSAANANDGILVVNWTAGGSTTTYVYELVNDAAANALVAAEISLIGIVDRGASVLTAADII